MTKPVLSPSRNEQGPRMHPVPRPAVPVAGPAGRLPTQRGFKEKRRLEAALPRTVLQPRRGARRSSDLTPGQRGRVAGAGLLVAWCRLLSVPGARLEWQRTLITLRPVSLRLRRAEELAPGVWGLGGGMWSECLPEERALGFNLCPWLLPLGPACALGKGRSVFCGCRWLPVSAWHTPPGPRSPPRGPRPP